MQNKNNSFTHFFVQHVDFQICVSSLSPTLTDESIRAAWGINIMKKGKKMGPKTFGVRLEDCLPSASNKVSKNCEFVPIFINSTMGNVFRTSKNFSKPTLWYSG